MQPENSQLFEVARQDKIVDYLKEHMQASIEDLVRYFSVSSATIRRDLTKLEERLLVTRTFGGAMIREMDESMSQFYRSLSIQESEKRAIARAAAGLLKDEETIIVDGGSTTYYFAEALMEKQVQVITNSLPIVNLLSKSESVEVIVTGGLLYPKSGLFLGPYARKILKTLNVSRLFMGVGGVSPKGITNANLLLVETEKVMMDSAEEIVVLADHSKFSNRGLSFLAPLSKIDVLVTDERTSEEHLKWVRSQKIKVVVAELKN